MQKLQKHLAVKTMAIRASRMWEEYGEVSPPGHEAEALKGSSWEILELVQLACGSRYSDDSYILRFVDLQANS